MMAKLQDNEDLPQELWKELSDEQQRVVKKEKDIIQYIFQQEYQKTFPGGSLGGIESGGLEKSFLWNNYGNFSCRTDFLGFVVDKTTVELEMIREDCVNSEGNEVKKKSGDQQIGIWKISGSYSYEGCDAGYYNDFRIYINDIPVYKVYENDSGYRDYCGCDDESGEESSEEEEEEGDAGDDQEKEEEDHEAKKKRRKHSFSDEEIKFVRSFFQRVRNFLFSMKRGGSRWRQSF